MDYFKKGYMDESLGLTISLTRGSFPVLDRVNLMGLSCLVSIEEVNNAIMDIGAHKAPSLDGLNAFFY